MFGRTRSDNASQLIIGWIHSLSERERPAQCEVSLEAYEMSIVVTRAARVLQGSECNFTLINDFLCPTDAARQSSISSKPQTIGADTCWLAAPRTFSLTGIDLRGENISFMITSKSNSIKRALVDTPKHYRQ
jgi:hypothetical protein